MLPQNETINLDISVRESFCAKGSLQASCNFNPKNRGEGNNSCSYNKRMLEESKIQKVKRFSCAERNMK